MTHGTSLTHGVPDAAVRPGGWVGDVPAGAQAGQPPGFRCLAGSGAGSDACWYNVLFTRTFPLRETYHEHADG